MSIEKDFHKLIFLNKNDFQKNSDGSWKID